MGLRFSGCATVLEVSRSQRSQVQGQIIAIVDLTPYTRSDLFTNFSRSEGLDTSGSASRTYTHKGAISRWLSTGLVV